VCFVVNFYFVENTMSILSTEIYQQPETIQQLLDNETANVQHIAKELQGKFDYILIAARGTSDNAARYAQYRLGIHNRIQVALATPSVFTTYDSAPNLDRALVIGVSQAGRSPDIVSIIEEGKRQGRPTLTITNDPEAPLAKAADYVIPLHAWPEQAVAATKSYTSSLAALALFSCALSGDGAALAQLQELPAWMGHTLQISQTVLSRVERYRYIDHCVVLGRGLNYATAFEVALKIKELTRVVTEPYSSADFLHGPVAIVNRGFPCIVVAPNGKTLPDMRSLYKRLTEQGAELLVISDQEDLLAQASLPFRLPPGIPEWLSPCVAVLPGQLFAMTLCTARGLNVDNPEGLSKVTQTW
jgi:glucosamine--fructose-6-phosphate aminotransferase (isomerizing)